MSEIKMMQRPLKITVVGDGAVGKTCLLIAYTSNTFSQEYIPTVFENYSAEHTVDGNTYSMMLWDTAGQEDYERLRPLSYPQTNAFILCFAIDNKVSLENVSIKWVPELKHHSRHTPIILVGTKKDVRNATCVLHKQGVKVCKKEGLSFYVECSAKTYEGIQEVFDRAIMAAEGLRNKDKFKCVIV